MSRSFNSAKAEVITRVERYLVGLASDAEPGGEASIREPSITEVYPTGRCGLFVRFWTLMLRADRQAGLRRPSGLMLHASPLGRNSTVRSTTPEAAADVTAENAVRISDLVSGVRASGSNFLRRTRHSCM